MRRCPPLLSSYDLCSAGAQHTLYNFTTCQFHSCSVPTTEKKQSTNKHHGYPSADILFLTSNVGVADSHGRDIVFTQHARARMADPNRGVVTEEGVCAVLANPTVRYVGIDGKQNALGEVNGKYVWICFVENKDRLLVITVINRGTRL